jgi:hypothetical protein
MRSSVSHFHLDGSCRLKMEGINICWTKFKRSIMVMKMKIKIKKKLNNKLIIASNIRLEFNNDD